jgi:hypothetical protein
MYIFDLLAVLFSGVFFISTFAFIMHCRALGIDPNLIVPGKKDIDIVFTCKLSGICFACFLGILCELTLAHPFIHLGLIG